MKFLIITISILISLSIVTHALLAQVMQSGSYQIQSDSVNAGGAFGSSSSYNLEDTTGEVGTGYSGSGSYSLHAGYQQMLEVSLSMTSASDVTMSPSLGGITGGTSNGQTSVTVTTDNPAGYQLFIKASSSPALVSGSNSFADYTPASSNPDFNFSVLGADSEFGFTPEGTDIDSFYKDNGSTCNTGSNDTTNSCWDALSTINKAISTRTSSNAPLGVLTTIKFRAESGPSHLQPQGIYTATTTLTALPN